MINHEKLISLIDAKGLKRVWLAHELNLSESAFRNKLQGKNEFKTSEIEILKDCLNLSQDEFVSTFFSL